MSTTIGSAQKVSNAQLPQEGAVALRAQLDFTGGVAATAVDLTNLTLPGPSFKLSYVQGLYVDASGSTVDILCVCGGTAQTIRFPAGTQTYAPIIAINPPTFTFAGKNGASPGVIVPVYFLNVPMPGLVMGQSSLSGFSFNGNNLLVQDTAAENDLAQITALISGGGLDVNVISGGGSGGGFLGPLTWKQASGANAITLYTPAVGKRFYLNNLKIQLDPSAFRSVAGGATLNFVIQDGGLQSIQGIFFVPQTAPTLSAATGPITLFSADDMGFLSAAVNNSLIFTPGNSLSGGAFYISFSVLTGDHA